MLLLIATALVGLTAGSPAWGQDNGEEAEGETIGGTLVTRQEADEGPPTVTGIEGVTFTVSQDGEEIGSDETDAEGKWVVPIPAPGTYQVAIDTDTLPDGVELRDPERSELDSVIVQRNQQKVVLFPLGGGAEGGGDSDLERVIDLAANGIKLGSIIALAAVGLSLIFGVTGLVNFAHGELVTFGAIVAWWANSSGGPGLTLIASAVVGVIAGCLLGGVLELGLWRPLRHRRLGNFSLMVVSIGLGLFLRHLYLLWYGAAPRKFAQYTLQDSVEIGPITMVPKDIIITVLSVGMLILFGIALKQTRLGTGLRAVSDNRDLAESSGIDVQRLILVTWIVGAGLAALGGVLYGASQNISWDTGFTLLLIMFAAVILGGLGSAYGAMVGGIIIGVMAEVSTNWLDVEFRFVTALVVLIVVLLIRPQGLLGVKERVG